LKDVNLQTHKVRCATKTTAATTSTTAHNNCSGHKQRMGKTTNNKRGDLRAPNKFQPNCQRQRRYQRHLSVGFKLSSTQMSLNALGEKRLRQIRYILKISVKFWGF